ncbi:sensor histidine kinase, partial [Nonomuraea rhizosphaerae]|uniref:sensor histidine kinase n=1 Tax=Nonomuraea rhizosphaerae TaxID=2665663 RepID=UPI001C5EA258
LAALAVTVTAGPPLTVWSMFFWWVPDEPPHLLTGVPLTGWGAAIGLGSLNLLLMAALGLVAVPPLARGHARLTRALLGSGAAEQLAERVEVLTRTRAGALDAHGAELARIERDLHDGTQARLVAIAMRLGMVKQELDGTPGSAAQLVQEAHDGAEAAMRELRTIIRTMYPPVLTDLGLAGAVHALAAQSPVPTRIELGELGEPPAAVEAATYFVVSEALTNVAKHSRATAATVSVRRAGDWLQAIVADDGRGGADESRGSGISGIRQRVAALDGTVRLDSPAGGPTSITVGLPCGS